MTRATPTILLSEGTSLSAKETINALGLSGARVDVCAPTRWSLGGLSRWVRHVHRTPASGVDPRGYADRVASLCATHDIDVLLPTHEQAYLFSALRVISPSWPREATAVPIARFEAFEALQTKFALGKTLATVGLRQPETFSAHTPAALLEHGRALLRSEGACIVKAPAGTASNGVRRIRTERELELLCESFMSNEDEPTIVQQLVDGSLERTQSIFVNGTLVAIHGYRQRLEGPGGGDILKESVHRPAVIRDMQVLGAHLAWHGALSFDYVLSARTNEPFYIDANPRLVEPMNAFLSGVDLAGKLVRVALGQPTGALEVGRAGVLTRLGIPGLIGASHTGRRGVLADFVAQVRSTGRYTGSVEELTPYRDDFLSVIPLVAVLARLLARPSDASHISRDTIESYALGANGYAFVRRIVDAHLRVARRPRLP